MNLAIEILGYGGAIPAVVALATSFLCRKCLPAAIRDEYAAAIGLAAGFFVGYAFLPSWAELQPKRHWQWLPYLAAGVALVGPIGAAKSSRRHNRIAVAIIVSLAVSWFLVPTWQRLDPIRYYWMAGLAAYLFLLITGLDSLAVKLPASRFFPGALTFVSATIAATTAYAVSAKYGQVTGVATAAVLGCWLAVPMFDSVRYARGLSPSFGILVGGLAFVGCIEPNPPLLALLLLPATPLGLWSFSAGPLSRLRGMSALAAHAAAIVLPVGLVVGWIAVATE